MTTKRTWRGMAGPPLIVQLFGLLVGALIAAQLVALLLTLVLPPLRPRQYALQDIAAALRAGTGSSTFFATVQAGPPDLSAPGWFVSATSRKRLARMLDTPESNVQLGFYTQLPVVGTVEPVRAPSQLPPDAARGNQTISAIKEEGQLSPATYLRFIDNGFAEPAVEGAVSFQEVPGGGFPRGGPPGTGMPGGGFPQSMPPQAPPPPTHMPPQQQPPQSPQRAPTPPPRGQLPPSQPRPAQPGQGQPPQAQAPHSQVPPSQTGQLQTPQTQTPQTQTGVPLATGQPPLQQIPGVLPAQRLGPQLVPGDGPLTRLPLLSADRFLPPVQVPPKTERPVERIAPTPWPTPAAPGVASRPPALAERTPAPAIEGPSAAPATGLAPPAAVTPAPEQAPQIAATEKPVAPYRTTTGLFGTTASPFVEGDFIAAARLPDGRWTLVMPRAEGFPNAWQRRLALWFFLSLLAVAPITLLFVRRIVGPLGAFARAAELLGRDPAGAVLPIEGPAEVGRAAHAFNQMQSRLRAFVDDRTAMIGAISHDLRTPLTRMRFRIEDVPDEQREGLLDEVLEMEAMISSVITFMRNANTPNVRERRDLAELLDDVVENAVLVGGDIKTVETATAMVEIDALGVRRILDNLLINAIKYGGGRARVKLRVEQSCAIADIIDDGPGISDIELERVFDPFYRSESAVRSGREGSGLGLAVCRSIARAHGGDVALFRSTEGFTARVILPLAYDWEREAA